ncbi:MAG: glycosyltransferase [SAR324 cluster bacterium]|nr:glycosyltransferase [SAR324 cluster bacterium]
MDCYHCNSKNIEYKFPIHTFSIYQCRDCELAFLFPQPSEEELSHIHANHHNSEDPSENERLQKQEVKSETIQLYLQELKAYTHQSDLRLLEIGIEDGDFLQATKEMGFQVNGIEANPAVVNSVNKKLGDSYVIQGTLDTIDFKKLGQFDVCVLLNVIDHVRDPYHFIMQIRKLLKDEGILFTATPSLDSWSAKLLKSRWMEFKAEHLFYFNTQNLESFLVKSGFTNINTSPSFKVVNFPYMHQYLQQYPIPFLSVLSKVPGWMFPSALQQKRFKFVASGIHTICKKRDMPAKVPKLSIIMPVYNERESFVETMEQVLNKHLEHVEKELIIVESNSTDGTKEEVAKYENHPGVTVIYEDQPQGKGHAVRNGLAHATGEILLIQDADQEYDVNDYDALLVPILNYQKMFVLGSRHTGDWKMRSFEDHQLMGFLLNSAHILFTWMINVACGAKLKDPFTMYKVFRKECLYGLEFEANRFDFDWEIVIKFLRKNYFPLEIPVNYSSRSFSEGKKVRLFHDPMLWMIALLKFRFKKLKKA